MEVGNEAAVVAGEIGRVVFRNEVNGWTVLELTDGDGTPVTVVGSFPELHAGERLRVRGAWVEHPSFGRQLKAEAYECELPSDADAILRYLSSGAIKGIGAATALRIVKKFGEDTLTVMEQQPERLAEVYGISLRKAREIGEAFAKQFGLREAMLSLLQYGLTSSEAVRCWKRWSSAALTQVRDNPYALCSGDLHIGFERADAIHHARGGADDDPHRLQAGLLYVLRHNTGNGHTCLPEDKLTAAASGLLEQPVTALEQALADAVMAGQIREEIMGGRAFAFLPVYAEAERYIAARVRQLAALRRERKVDAARELQNIESRHRIQYAPLQRQAIAAALDGGMLILTGGPGTGKTTTLRAILALLEANGEAVCVAAPTGRAAKRATELTGREAMTVHRLLEVQWDDEERPVFSRDERNPLDADAVIVDEASMVDTLLMDSLLHAMRPDCRLILVGDSDQLPAVGAGCVLADLLAAGEVPAVQLTEVFRQAMESQIVSAAHAIVRGEMPDLSRRDGDGFFLERAHADAVADTLVDLCVRRLPDTYGVSCREGLQVLCPGRKGMLGTVQINRRLQEALNPPAAGKREITVNGTVLREGDKVMHTRNNYDIVWTLDNDECGTGVFNGDIGILESVDTAGDQLLVRYDNRTAVYTRQDAQDLDVAYAITVHKSQGSEFPLVVLPLFDTPPLLCYRNLLYTAVTRAKTVLVMVGSRHTLGDMVANDKKVLRYSGLRYFLTQEKTPWDD